MKWRKNTKSRLWNIGLSLLMFGLVVGCTGKEAPNSPDESNRTSNESNTSKEVPNENITEEQAPVSSKGSKEDSQRKNTIILSLSWRKIIQHRRLSGMQRMPHTLTALQKKEQILLICMPSPIHHSRIISRFSAAELKGQK